MQICEIFKSIDGEGKRAGELATFIRTVGCNLTCGYCDSKYSWKRDETTQDMTVADIISKVDELDCYNITLTGGEPLIAKGVKDLVDELLTAGYNVNIETNGSIDPYTVLSTKSLTDKNLFFTIDYKSLSSKQNSKMNIDAFKHMQYKDVVKCVVGSEEDMVDCVRFMKNVYNINTSDLHNVPQFYFSPIFGQIEPKEIVKFMMDSNLDWWKIQLQMHKFIWNPDLRGV